MGPDDGRWNRLSIVLLLAFSLLALYGRQRGIFWGGDDADYILLSRSLLQGRYVDLFDVALPPHTTYPPVYPAMLALWGLVFGDTLTAFATLGVLLMASAIGLFVHLVAVGASPRAGFVAALVTTTNPHLMEAAGRILSETPMLLFASATAWLAIRRQGPGGTGLAIAAATLCALTRTAGVAVIAGLGLYWLSRRRWWAAAMLALAATVFVGGWILWTLQDLEATGVTTYVTRISVYDRPDVPLWRVLLTSGIQKASAIVGSQIPAMLALPTVPGTRLDNLLWFPISLASLLGLALVGMKRPVVGMMAFAYGLVLFAWPFAEERLLIPVLMLLLFGAPVGVHAVLGRYSRRLGRLTAGGVAILLAAAGAWGAARALPCDGSVMSATSECVRSEEMGIGRAIRYLETTAGEGEIVMARRGEVLHYYTGNPTVDWPTLGYLETLGPAGVLERSNAKYVLATRAYVSRSAGLAQLLEETCGRLSVAFADLPNTLVLEVHDAATPPETPACPEVAAYVGLPASGSG